jgi:hypothetical protein
MGDVVQKRNQLPVDRYAIGYDTPTFATVLSAVFIERMYSAAPNAATGEQRKSKRPDRTVWTFRLVAQRAKGTG